ncbi:metallophosphoesterase family protein [Acetilactobacillus jinshanensis]|uniref:Exonuclease SbcCD subunit D n=1 Tax=Acetilactobacillus jinshanensis TaxID=1720083 RepID=A0A4P6ZMM9_9LACO|nr:exonuclease SbcCD subunit D [Acetilactobacillus jinshanensis]QBP18692.1 exonuclease SbcCD subunit D [Acetilactobacillus jinshanensis]URL61567.1 exonuclease SbcCD subunit D [uncultured bacterium]
MKFIHTADLHLDSPFDNLRNDGTPDAVWNLVYHSTYQSFAKIVRSAIDQQVDFVLIVGDLFDRQDQNVHAQNFLKHELSLLDQHQIPVLLSFGNHDYYSGDYQKLSYPGNTYVFPKQVTTKSLKLRDGTIVNVTGFSYGSRWEQQRIINDFPVKHDCDYQIGMIHGQISSGSSNYTPFSLDELLSKHYDYWALGHIHKRQVLNKWPPVVYPGNIQGRTPNETGDKGYLLVDSNHQFQPEFHATSLINWVTLPVQVTTVKDENELVDLILSTVQQQKYQKFHLVNIQLQLTNATNVNSDLITLINNQNLLDQLQALLQNHYQEWNAWVYNVTLSQHHDSKLQLKSDVWKKSADQVFQIGNVDQIAKKLFQRSFINQRFNKSKAINQLKQHVTQLILNHRGSQDDN